MTSPRNRILPRRGGGRPRIVCSVVVLPIPLRPRSPTTSPGRTSSETPSRKWLAPSHVWIWWSESKVSFMAVPPAHVDLDHPLVALDLLGRSSSKHLAEVQHGDRIGNGEHHVHVVLDDQQRDFRREGGHQR